MTGGRGIEDDMIIAAGLATKQSAEFVECGDFGGAGAGELLSHGRTFSVARARLHLVQHAASIGFGRDIGIDDHHGKSGCALHRRRLVLECDTQHLIEIRGGIRADQQDRLAAIR